MSIVLMAPSTKASVVWNRNFATSRLRRFRSRFSASDFSSSVKSTPSSGTAYSIKFCFLLKMFKKFNSEITYFKEAFLVA
jgi:hypothetical protein